MSAKILFHPTLLARRITESQGGRVERDACGRPFILPSADPLAPPAEVHDEPEPLRFERLIRALRALAAWVPSTEAPGRVHRQGPR